MGSILRRADIRRLRKTIFLIGLGLVIPIHRNSGVAYGQNPAFINVFCSYILFLNDYFNVFRRL